MWMLYRDLTTNHCTMFYKSSGIRSIVYFNLNCVMDGKILSHHQSRWILSIILKETSYRHDLL